jgi:hypothetical protein
VAKKNIPRAEAKLRRDINADSPSARFRPFCAVLAFSVLVAGTHALIRFLELRLIRPPGDLVNLLSHAACPSWLTHRNVLASRHIQWRITASLRATGNRDLLAADLLDQSGALGLFERLLLQDTVQDHSAGREQVGASSASRNWRCTRYGPPRSTDSATGRPR